MRGHTPRPFEDRLFEKINKTDTCWLWTGYIKPTGYGAIKGPWPSTKNMHAHRATYELLVGPIPEGLVIDHLCRVRSCVNPEHLEPVTTWENLMRGETVYARNLAKTHCPQGHELTPDNCVKRPNKRGRDCKTCHRDRERVARRRREQLKKDVHALGHSHGCPDLTEWN